jgi:hypothetical protein
MEAFFHRHTPKRQSVLSVFASLIFFINLWAIYNLLMVVPSWLKSMTVWDAVGALSYVLAFALLESLVLLVPLVLLSYLLPARFFHDIFTAQGTMLAMVTVGFLVAAHLYGDRWQIWTPLYRHWRNLFLAALVISPFLVYFIKILERGLRGFADRVQVLALFYAALGVIALGIVLVRGIL